MDGILSYQCGVQMKDQNLDWMLIPFRKKSTIMEICGRLCQRPPLYSSQPNRKQLSEPLTGAIGKMIGQSLSEFIDSEKVEIADPIRGRKAFCRSDVRHAPLSHTMLLHEKRDIMACAGAPRNSHRCPTFLPHLPFDQPANHDQHQ